MERIYKILSFTWRPREWVTGNIWAEIPNIALEERSKLLKLQNESAKLGERIDVLFDRIGEDGRDEYYLKHLDKKKARHRIVSKEIEILEHRLKLPLKKVGIHHISAFCDHMRNQLHDDKSPIRKQMVQMIIEKVVPNPEKVAVEGSDFELAAIAANWSTANLQRVVRRDVSNWWSQTGSNRRPQHCQCCALPTELWPHRTL